MSALAHEVATQHEASLCASCGAKIDGRFCPQCGEELAHHDDYSLNHFFKHTVLHEFLHVNETAGRTIQNLLLRPGFLSQEYFSAPKRLYLNPLRVMLTAAVLFFLLAPQALISITFATWKVTLGSFVIKPLQLRLSMVPPSFSEKSIEDSVQYLDYFGFLTPELHWVEGHVNVEDKGVEERFRELLESYGEILSFCSVVPLALTLWLIYGRKRRSFVEHLVFSLHLEAFLLLLGIVVNCYVHYLPWHRLNQVTQSIALLVSFAALYGPQAWYLQNALIRFYEPTQFPRRYSPVNPLAWKTALVGVVLFLANSLFLSTVHSLGAAIALWRL